MCIRISWKVCENAKGWVPTPDILVNQSGLVPENLHLSKLLSDADADGLGRSHCGRNHVTGGPLPVSWSWRAGPSSLGVCTGSWYGPCRAAQVASLAGLPVSLFPLFCTGCSDHFFPLKMLCESCQGNNTVLCITHINLGLKLGPFAY